MIYYVNCINIDKYLVSNRLKKIYSSWENKFHLKHNVPGGKCAKIKCHNQTSRCVTDSRKFQGKCMVFVTTHLFCVRSFLNAKFNIIVVRKFLLANGVFYNTLNFYVNLLSKGNCNSHFDSTVKLLEDRIFLTIKY